MPSHPHTDKPKAGNVAFVVTSQYGPKVYFQPSLRDGLQLLARFVSHQCTDGSETVWVFENRKWVAL